MLSAEDLLKGGYIGYVVNDDYPHGKCIIRYDTIEELMEHIDFQKEFMGSKDDWHVMHIKSTFMY